MKPSIAVQQYRTEIRRLVAAHGASNPRVFGSSANGTDTEESDIDLLVDPIPGTTTLMSLARIQCAINSLTGIATDVRTPLSLPERFRQAVLDQAVRI
jgi:hypothetical protein